MSQLDRYKDGKIPTNMRFSYANKKRLTRIAEHENTNRTAVIERFIAKRYAEIKDDIEKI